MMFSGVFTHAISPKEENATATATAEGGTKFPKIFRERTCRPTFFSNTG